MSIQQFGGLNEPTPGILSQEELQARDNIHEDDTKPLNQLDEKAIGIQDTVSTDDGRPSDTGERKASGGILRQWWANLQARIWPKRRI